MGHSCVPKYKLIIIIILLLVIRHVSTSDPQNHHGSIRLEFIVILSTLKVFSSFQTGLESRRC